MAAVAFPWGGWRLSSSPLPEPWAPGRSDVGCSPQPARAADRQVGASPPAPRLCVRLQGSEAERGDADPTFSNTKAFCSSFVVLSRTSQGTGAGRRGKLFFFGCRFSLSPKAASSGWSEESLVPSPCPVSVNCLQDFPLSPTFPVQLFFNLNSLIGMTQFASIAKVNISNVRP